METETHLKQVNQDMTDHYPHWPKLRINILSLAQNLQYKIIIWLYDIWVALVYM